jgi:hypothetical protein
METAVAQFGHVLEPGDVGAVADTDNGNSNAFFDQPFDEFGDAFFLFGVGTIGEEDEVFDLVTALGQGFRGCFEAGADVDSAAACPNLANLVDNFFALGGRGGADGVIGGGIYWDERDIVEVVEQLDDQESHFPSQL